MKKALLLIVFAPSALLSQNVDFCIGSCADYTGERNEEIFSAIVDKKPDFFLWLGDNIYSTEPNWGNKKSMAKAYIKRHSTKPISSMFDIITKQYAIWDDHDFGPNDADSSFSGKNISAKIFESVWSQTPVNLSENGDIRWRTRNNEIALIGLDNRSHRGPIGTHILGDDQLNWLRETLIMYEDARVVFIAIGSQVLNDAKVYENYSRFPEERLELLKICSESNSQIVFLTGDRHHGELNIKYIDNKRLIDITSSPLTSSTHDPSKKEMRKNNSLVHGSIVNVNHFNRIIWDGEFNLSTEFIDVNGDVIFQKSWFIEN